MQKNIIARLIASALALGACGSALAGPSFYGAISYGQAVSSGDDTINYALFDSTDTGNFSPLGTDYGNSRMAGLKLGMRFENHLFLELAGSEMKFDGAAAGGNGGTNDCTIAPSAGLIDDCFDDASIAFDSKIQNTDLVVGWTFSPTENWKLEPYAGLRRVKLNDNRVVDYTYDQLSGGFNDFITDSTSFNKTGAIAGLRVQRDFGQLFFSADLNYSHASGTRSRLITDTEYRVGGGDGEVSSAGISIKAIPSGATVTDSEQVLVNENVSVNQWKARFAVGHQFKLSENNTFSISIGYNLGRASGFDTRDTNPAVESETNFALGSLGNQNASLKTSGADFTMGWNF